MKTKVVVLGAGGMAGHVISIYLEQRGFIVYGFSRSKLPFLKYNVIHEIDDFERLAEEIDTIKPSYLINCVGILNKESVNSDYLSIKFNSLLPKYLERLYLNSEIKIIHISTDCVFSGSQGNYDEYAIPDGMSIYDRTKAIGEISNSKDLTIRCSIIGPDIKENGIGLFNWFMKNDGPIYGYTNVLWTGVTTIVLSKAIEGAIENNVSGLYNLASDYKISKFELLNLFNKLIKFGEVEIQKDGQYIIDKSLIDSRRILNNYVKGYDEMINEMKEWINDYMKIYSHYDYK